jgi:glyoxylase-like metal-dependent hydrolase (beta-lactamase superfamily II)
VEAGGWQIELIDVASVPIDAEHLGPPGEFEGTLRPPVNVLLLRGHGRTVLVDAGPGPLLPIWPDSTGADLDQILAAHDAEPDLLIATHLDWDHCGGFVAGTWPDGLVAAFAGRPVLMPADAVEEARTEADPAHAPARVVAALDAVGLVQEYGDGDEPAPGLKLRSAPGHRTGHSILEVGDTFVHAADVFHLPPHVEHPEWDTAFDADPELGLETRRALLAELAERGATVVVSHMDSPGRIRGEAGGFRWEPISE